MKILVCISSVPDTTSRINFIENETRFDQEVLDRQKELEEAQEARQKQ